MYVLGAIILVMSAPIILINNNYVFGQVIMRAVSECGGYVDTQSSVMNLANLFNLITI